MCAHFIEFEFKFQNFRFIFISLFKNNNFQLDNCVIFRKYRKEDTKTKRVLFQLYIYIYIYILISSKFQSSIL